MSDRSFFSLRYAVPGYTFILIILALNYILLPEIIETLHIEPLFGAILSLLSGYTLGFIISQIWWLIFQRKGADYELSSMTRRTIINKYQLTNSNKTDDKKKVIVIQDYVLHTTCEKLKQNKFCNYIERRWDMYHLLSSEIYTLLFGLIAGSLCRLFFEHFLHENFLLEKIQYAISNFNLNWLLENGETFTIFFTYIIVVIFLLLLHEGRKWVRFQHDASSAAIIKSSKITKHELGKIFPPNYFNLGITDEMASKLEDQGIFSLFDLAWADSGKLDEKIGDSEDLSNWINMAREYIELSS